MTMTENRPVTDLRCWRCAQRLFSQTSRERGACRPCTQVLTDMIAQISLDYSPKQLVKAAHALATGRVEYFGDTPSREAYAKILSSNYTVTYVTTLTGCSCPSPMRCYHSAALRIADLAPVR